jgi:hypothetical protein
MTPRAVAALGELADVLAHAAALVDELRAIEGSSERDGRDDGQPARHGDDAEARFRLHRG